MMNNEVLNIISDTYDLENKYGGPSKVIINTVKGLRKVGHPFVLNKHLSDYRFNWVHDSPKGLIQAGLEKSPSVIGPNIAVLPEDLSPIRFLLKNKLYLQPSPWCVNLWKIMGFKECELLSWPAGIDTDEFELIKRHDPTKNVMVYWKRRDPKIFDRVITTLKNMGLTPHIIKCGNYTEDQYKETLKKSKFGIWLGTSESQGIALQEALSTNLPLIVCDVQSLFEATGPNDYQFPNKLRNFKPTSAPYFDERCGIILDDISYLEQTIKTISTNIDHYKPREYIVENLSLEKQASELLSYFEYLKKKHKNYFQININKKIPKAFRLSLIGNMIYLLLILRRKTKSFFRLINKKLRK